MQTYDYSRVPPGSRDPMTGGSRSSAPAASVLILLLGLLLLVGAAGGAADADAATTATSSSKKPHAKKARSACARQARTARQRKACRRAARKRAQAQRGGIGTGGDGSGQDAPSIAGAPAGGSTTATAPREATPAADTNDCAGADDSGAPGDAVTGAVLCLVNVERRVAGVSALHPDLRLVDAAHAHAADMISQRYFDHAGLDGSAPGDRIAATGYVATDGPHGPHVGENIAWASAPMDTPRTIVLSWVASPGHRANLLSGDFAETGLWVEPQTPAGGPGLTYVQTFGSGG